ncbi:MAG: ribosomal protein S18-alanine N-acetyltransferase [Clostridiales bacterium]|nr:ribosomal protein S18-alanine N-acetyltransferase [Clostridiales bacterium]
MTVSIMTKEDVGSVAALEKECFASPWTQETLLEETDNPTAVFFTSKQDGKVIGYIGSNNILGEVFITNIAVKNEYRRTGVASLLLDTLIKKCKSEKAVYITLEVRKSNFAAIKLYEKYGFSLVGERKNFYSNPDEDALLYTLTFDYD